VRSGSKRRRSLYLVPVTALVLVILLYYLAYAPLASPTIVQEFTVRLSIQRAVPDQQSQYRFIIPPPIGVPGGTWNNHTWDSEGIGGKYPVYTLFPPNPYPGYTEIRVQSRVSRVYTLADFFAVYGQPLGQNDTVGLTSPPPAGSPYTGNWFWTMCVGQAVTNIRPGTWGAEALVPGKQIILLYATSSCF